MECWGLLALRRSQQVLILISACRGKDMYHKIRRLAGEYRGVVHACCRRKLCLAGPHIVGPSCGGSVWRLHSLGRCTMLRPPPLAQDPSQAELNDCHFQRIYGLMNVTSPRAGGPDGPPGQPGPPIFMSCPHFCHVRSQPLSYLCFVALPAADVGHSGLQAREPAGPGLPTLACHLHATPSLLPCALHHAIVAAHAIVPCCMLLCC